MSEPSRRTVLAGLSTATLAAIAGCTGQLSGDSDDPDEEAPTGWQDDLSLPKSVVTGLGYVYDHDDGNSLVVTIGDMSDWSSPGILEDGLATANPEWHVLFGPAPELSEWGPVAVFAGEFEPADGTERGEFTLQEIDVTEQRLGPVPDEAFPDDEGVVATNGKVAVLGARDQVTATLDSHANGEEPYLASDGTARRMLDELGAGGQIVLATDSEPILEQMREDRNVDIGELPDPIGLRFEESQDIVEVSAAAGTTDEGVVDDLKTFAADFYAMDAVDTEFEHRTTGRLLLVEGAEVIDRPGGPDDAQSWEMHVSFDTYDKTAGELLFHVHTGEPVSVAELTVEIAGETYERDWARGAEELDEGSRIAIDTDVVEPGDTLTVTREREDSTIGSSRSVLGNLPFELDYDPGESTATLHYADGPPLSGERTELRVLDEIPTPGPRDDDSDTYEGGRAVSLSGDLTPGDSLTVEDVEPGRVLVVVYERMDGETVAVFQRPARPPGQFEFGVEGGTLLVARRGLGEPSEQEPLPADRYEVRIDGEPTDRQWTDRDGVIEPGDSLEASEIEGGERATVAWVGKQAEFELASAVVPPDIRVVATYDEDEDAVRLVHDGGQSVDADLLTVVLGFEDGRTHSWDGDTISEADELLVEPDDGEIITLQMQGEPVFEPVFVPELREEGETTLEPAGPVSSGG